MKKRPVHRACRPRWRSFARGVVLAVVGLLAGLLGIHLEEAFAKHAAVSSRVLDRLAARFTVVAVSPSANASQVSPSARVTIRFSEPLALDSPLPRLSPPEDGSWRRVGTDELVFTPSVPVLPLTTETLSIQRASSGVRAANGALLAHGLVEHWQVRDASVLRLQQVLAGLGYLPLTWTAATKAPSGPEADLAALYDPPAGSFAWRYPNTPATLEADWAPGVDNAMTRGAMVSFEVHDGLPGYTSIRPLLWPALLGAEKAGREDPVGYTYALVSQALPETLTLWHNGADVLDSVVNTGIAATPTPVGTFFVYRRFASTTMSGTNPDGAPYLDTGVRWVSYFDGGVAIHGFVRASYGFPQSLGCVELPLAMAARAWGWIHYGTLVTVLAEPSATKAASAAT
jgi:hypothetical protein